MATQTLITGNTYPVKDQIRGLGGTWDRTAKGWRVPAERVAEARALVDAAPVDRGGRRWSRKLDTRTAYQQGDRSSGALRSHYDPKGVYAADGRYMGSTGPRCEDAPCCGCCS